MFKGTDESQSSQNQEDAIPAIEKQQIANPTISVDHIICSICHHILWDPITCGSPSGCHNSFCNQCISLWLENSNKLCPTCKRIFVKTSAPPILKSLLQSLIISCNNKNNGCEQVSLYQQYPNHHRQCLYKLQKCKGCKNRIISLHYADHTTQCDQFVVECHRCKSVMTKAALKKSHSRIDCFHEEIDMHGDKVSQLENTIKELDHSLTKLETLTKHFMQGQPLQLNIELYTTFNQHFIFPNPTLIKPSFNQQKEKFDFLHFYVLNPIHTDSIASMKWSIKINKMIGSILVGFCSSMNVNSVDLVITKYGELKRKDKNENKYKLVRKSQQGFVFGCGDVLRFKYFTLGKCVRIENQTKRVGMLLKEEEIEELGDKIYCFYSMDTLNDSISFI